MADSTTTTYPVARVYKDTGKFEGLEGIECGKTKINLDNEWSGLLSGDTIRCGNGWKFKLNSGTWSSLPSASSAMMFYGTNDGMYDTVVRLSVAGRSGGSGVADITLLGNNWDCSGEANVSTIIFSDAPGWSATTITVIDENENTVGVFNGSSTALSWNASTTLKIPQDKRYKYESTDIPSVSKQGICTFSEIVEDTHLPASISKSTGVLTCSEFIEGDYGAEYRCASGFSGTISGNKITCNNGYQFELLLQSDQSAVNWSSVLGGGTGIFGLNGSATEDAINGSTFGGSLNTNDGYNTCTFTDPNSSTSAWITSPTLYVYSILTALVTTELYYLKITDPAGKSVLYENSTAAKETFYPIESGEDEWWIPSKYRYQNYLT